MINLKIGITEADFSNQEQFNNFATIHDFPVPNAKELSANYLEYLREGQRVSVATLTDGAKEKSFLVWEHHSKESDADVSLEVYQAPNLHGYGKNLEEASQMLADVISDLYTNLKDNQNEELSEEMQHTRDLLNRLIKD